MEISSAKTADLMRITLFKKTQLKMLSVNPKFLLDGMLGSLASWLRICGYDSIYHKDMNDDSLIAEANKEHRILLTRDKQLYERCKKHNVTSYYVMGDKIIEQLSYLCINMGISLTPSSSRCSNCNSEIMPVDKDDIKEKIPENSYKHYDEFWKCNSCDKVFWMGSHWNKILETLNLAQEGCEQNL